MSLITGIAIGTILILVGIAAALARGAPAAPMNVFGHVRHALNTRMGKTITYGVGIATVVAFIVWLAMRGHTTAPAATNNPPAVATVPVTTLDKVVDWILDLKHLGFIVVMLTITAAIIPLTYYFVRYVVTPTAAVANHVNWNGLVKTFAILILIGIGVMWYLDPTIVGTKWNTLLSGFGISETPKVEQQSSYPTSEMTAATIIAPPAGEWSEWVPFKTRSLMKVSPDPALRTIRIQCGYGTTQPARPENVKDFPSCTDANWARVASASGESRRVLYYFEQK